jgi:plastocyanin
LINLCRAIAVGVLAACLFFLTNPAPAAIINVSYGDFFFDPAVVTINVGDTINWSTNTGGDTHTLLGTGADPICGGNLLPCSYTFDTAGTFPYECTIPGHAEAGMTGVIIVMNPPLPVIITQPQSQTVLTNTTVTFSVTASNATSYQWLSNSVDLLNQTNDTLILNNVVTNDSATYQVVVSNATDAVTSSNAVLLVLAATPPVIITQPQSQTVLTNTTVTFSVTASNATSYQWESNTIALPGATNDFLTLSNVIVADSATYQVVVSNATESVTSSNAVLVVQTVAAPVITAQPQSTNAPTNTTVTFSVTASNAASYQWLSNSVDLLNQTNDTLILGNVVTGDSGSYQVVVSNVSGAVTSSNAVLVVGAPASITRQPAGLEVSAGTPVTLQVGAAGSPAPQYQWFLNGLRLAGQTNATLVLGTATTNIDGTYFVIVSNLFGPQTSSNAVLTVDPLTSIIREKLAVTIAPAKSGSVRPNLNGKSLIVANTYAVTAVAASGQAFANWTGIVQSDDPSLTFVMPDVSNATLTANFIPSPFASNGVAGTYTGLFWDTNNLSSATSGYFSATLDDNGVIAGQVKNAGVSTVFSTTLRADGSASLELKRRNLGTLVLTLQVDLPGLEMLTGAVGDVNNTFNAQLTACRTGFDASHKATNYAGYYTWAMPGAATNAPAGYSYGTAAVAAAGDVRLILFLSDRTITTASGSLSAYGQMPLYVSLYGGKGSLLAWLSFTNSTSIHSTNGAYWLKDTVASGSYANGFTLTNLLLWLGEYSAEEIGTNALDAASVSVRLSDADLTNSIAGAVILNPNGIGGSFTNIVLTLFDSTGMFTGTFKEPDSGGMVRFNGIVLRSLPAGYGFFTRDDLSGAVLITPP